MQLCRHGPDHWSELEPFIPSTTKGFNIKLTELAEAANLRKIELEKQRELEAKMKSLMDNTRAEGSAPSSPIYEEHRKFLLDVEKRQRMEGLRRRAIEMWEREGEGFNVDENAEEYAKRLKAFKPQTC